MSPATRRIAPNLPMLTFAFCTYNRADRLERLVAAMRAQACPVPFEILAINNNSQDNTEQVLTRLAAQPGAPLRWVTEPVQGIVAARNRGIAEAMGSDILVYIDDDEIPLPGLIAAAADAILKEGAQCAGGRVDMDFTSVPRPPWLGDELLGFLAAVDHGRQRFWITDDSKPIWTANVAYDMRLFRDDPELRFDKRFDRIGNVVGGGSDADHVAIVARAQRPHPLPAGYGSAACGGAVASAAALLPAVALPRRPARGPVPAARLPEEGVRHPALPAGAVPAPCRARGGDVPRPATRRIAPGHERSACLGVNHRLREASLMLLTVLICTHDRAGLLKRVLDSLNAARRPAEGVQLLVAANNCSDGTHALLQTYAGRSGNRLPLRWLAVPTPGKSHALNEALPRVDTPLVALVDDDHRVDAGFLQAICQAAHEHPQAHLFCGRILPDWDGREPAWVHDAGPYRIYPLPVPRFDQGDEGCDLELGGSAMPGGGNLFLRTAWAAKIGGFAIDMGPHGHDLGGAEDIDWVLRGLRLGARLRYVPEVVQHHYVDTSRLTLPYLVKKAYKRTASTQRLQPGQPVRGVPLYLYRKIAGYAIRALLALDMPRRRFYCVRTAAALGEMSGHLAARRSTANATVPQDGPA